MRINTVLFGIIVLLAVTNVAEAAPNNVWFEPNNVIIEYSNTTEVDIILNATEGIMGFDIWVEYNPDCINITESSSGDFPLMFLVNYDLGRTHMFGISSTFGEITSDNLKLATLKIQGTGNCQTKLVINISSPSLGFKYSGGYREVSLENGTVTSTKPESSNKTTINTDYFNITFDREHGGVVTSLKYLGVEFLTGEDNGKWGAIGLRRSLYDGGLGVCTRWATEMDYQYDQNHDLTVEETDTNYTVTISPNGSSEVLGTDKEIVWVIEKHHGLIRLSYQPEYGNEYLYLPFIRNYDFKIGTIDYHTTVGIITAEDLPYCQSRWYTASMVEYKLHSGIYSFGVSIAPTELSTTSAYYGNDTKTWQLHYPFEGTDLKEFNLVFNEEFP